jgi:MYXO-CTERM domain-containing protein
LKRSLLFATALAWAVSASAARAGLASWTYNWEPNAPAVFADNVAGGGKITLTDEPLGSAVGTSDIVATNLKVFSNADPLHPDTLTHKGYILTLVLTDTASHQSGSVKFSGEFNGTISSASSNITNTYTSSITATLVLGQNSYTVTMGKYTPPSPPGATNFGSISANTVVTVTPLHGGSPEPPTVVLAGLGLVVLGGAAWRRRRQTPEAVPAGA